MRSVFPLFFLVALFLSGCQESSNHRPYILNQEHKAGVNPNSLAYVAEDKAAQRANLLAMKKLETEAKVKVTQIESKKDLDIAKLDSETKKEIAKATVAIKKEADERNFYIAMAFIAVLLLALLLWFLNSRKNRDLKARLEEQRLHNEMMLKAKELEHERANKLLELVAKGKLPAELETEIICTITTTQAKNDVIEHKK